jgi:hypothetical protein
MPRTTRRLLVLLCWLGGAALAPAAWAVSAVHPFGVNVRSSGPTTVFLTFQNLDPGEVAVEAFWCGELQPALMAASAQLQLPVPVQTSNPCVPGTVYGRLPLALDRSRTSASGTFTNLTDVMTIPPSVARRAYQDAQAGLHSAFFYVRRFSGPAGERFVVVTCRMAGGGARVPLALMDVRLAFDIAGTRPTLLVLAPGQRPPRLSARIAYNGSGTLRGRWEVVLPGDAEPTDEDLLTAATLPPEQRLRQRRWTLLERFDSFLPPSGEFTLPGPDPARLPHEVEGPYKVLLRVEASDDREGTSDTGGGRLVAAAGVAGFPMPVLRYVVGAPVAGSAAGFGRGPTLLLPAARGSSEFAAEVPANVAPAFAWADPAGAALLRLEVHADETGGWFEVLSALVRPGVGRYAPPPWFVEQQRGKPLRWRVVVLDGGGRVQAASEWRRLLLP